MGRITYVVEYPDGQEPAVHAGMDISGGELVAVQFNDALDELEQANYQIEEMACGGY